MLVITRERGRHPVGSSPSWRSTGDNRDACLFSLGSMPWSPWCRRSILPLVITTAIGGPTWRTSPRPSLVDIAERHGSFSIHLPSGLCHRWWGTSHASFLADTRVVFATIFFVVTLRGVVPSLFHRPLGRILVVLLSAIMHTTYSPRWAFPWWEPLLGQ